MLAYAQQTRESCNQEQVSLNERIQEYKRQIDRQSNQSLSGVQSSPNGDGVQSFSRKSHKVIEEVMQSAAKGKVLAVADMNFPLSFLHDFPTETKLYKFLSCIIAMNIFSDTNYSARISLKTFLQFKR